MHSRYTDDAGSVTAEFAVVLPAVLLVLAGCLGGVRVAIEQLRLGDAAALAARSLARGDDAATAAALAREQGAAGIATVQQADGLRCVTARRSVVLLAVPLPLVARSCALGAPAP